MTTKQDNVLALRAVFTNEVIRAIGALARQQNVCREQGGQVVFVTGMEAAREYILENVMSALTEAAPPDTTEAKSQAAVGNGEQPSSVINSQAPAEAAQPQEQVISACEDCGLPYEAFPIDTVLPDADWLEIHPSGDGGLLCAGCIAKRAAALSSTVIVFARLVRGHEHEAFTAAKNIPWGSAEAATQEQEPR